MNIEQQSTLGKWLSSRAGLGLLAFLAIAGFFLVTEHTAHLFGILPYLLLLLCPLLHLFMHRGHTNNGVHTDLNGHSGQLEISRHNPEEGKR